MKARYLHFLDRNPLENPIYLDTDILAFTFGVDAGWSTPTDKSIGESCKNFLARTVLEDVVTATSLHALAELRVAISIGMYKALAKSAGLGNSAKVAYAQRPEYMKDVHAEIERIEQLITRLPNLVILETPIDGEALERAIGLAFQYNVEPGDAIHLSPPLRPHTGEIQAGSLKGKSLQVGNRRYKSCYKHAPTHQGKRG